MTRAVLNTSHPRSVGIITFHHADNYGAVLQAYGLSQAIHELGHPVEIIDYRPLAARRIYNRLGLRSGKTIQVLVRRWRFHRFRRQFLPLSGQRYLTSEALAANSPQVDCFICGSDQVWNVESLRGFDPPMFLDFARLPNTTKASYAATFGGASDLGPNHERIIDLLRTFDFISVRDTHSQTFVNSLIGRVPRRVLDPSFLTDFGPITPPAMRAEPYILVYCMERTPEFLQTVAAVQRNLRLPMVCIGPDVEGAQEYRTAGPLEWLSLVKYARFIITNSFHGLCFSIINRKDFLAVPHTKGQVRLDDLLAWFNLDDRVIRDRAALEAIETGDLRVDYTRVEGPLQTAITESRNFLCEVLRG